MTARLRNITCNNSKKGVDTVLYTTHQDRVVAKLEQQLEHNRMMLDNAQDIEAYDYWLGAVQSTEEQLEKAKANDLTVLNRFQFS